MDNPGQVLSTPDWEVELSAQLTLTLHCSPAAGQLRPEKKNLIVCMKYAVDTGMPSLPPLI